MFQVGDVVRIGNEYLFPSKQEEDTGFITKIEYNGFGYVAWVQFFHKNETHTCYIDRLTEATKS